MKKRKCRTCETFKNIIEFGKLKASSDGLNTICKSCNAAAALASYYRHLKRNRITHKKSAIRWRKNNKSHISKHMKEYYGTNSNRIKRRQKRRIKAKPENRKRSLQKYYNKNKEKCRRNLRDWRRKNPKKAKAQSNVRRHKVRKATPKWLSKKLFVKVVNFYERCPTKLTVDHIVPINGEKVSGLNVPWNLQYLTPSRNSSKGNRINLLEASEQYGKILKKVGLK